MENTSSEYEENDSLVVFMNFTTFVEKYKQVDTDRQIYIRIFSIIEITIVFVFISCRSEPIIHVVFVLDFVYARSLG